MAHSPVQFSAQVLAEFKCYSWPGNIREMKNIIERALILSEGDTITPDQISLFNDTEQKNKSNNNRDNQEDCLNKLSLDEYLIHFLEQNKDKTETYLAKQLGISRKTLWEKRNRLNIPKKIK